MQSSYEQKMTAEEAATYKLAKLWEAEVERMFPAKERTFILGNQNKLPLKSDPRKCNLFSHCWKLRRTLKGLIKPEQWGLYIKANLTILKKYDARIDIQSMIGDNAWKRWKVYERWYRTKENETLSTPQLEGIHDRKVVGELDQTKKYIFENCEGSPTAAKLALLNENGTFDLWVMSARVSKYYLVLSPFVKPHLERLVKACRFEVALYEGKISDGVRYYFQQEFNHEFH